MDAEKAELLTQTIFVKSEDKMRYDLEMHHAQTNPDLVDKETIQRPKTYCIKSIVDEGLEECEFFMAKQWSSCLEDEFHLDFKMSFSKQEVFFNESNCNLLIITIDNLQTSSKRANKDWAQAINTVQMAGIQSFIKLAQGTFNKMNVSLLDTRQEKALFGITCLSNQFIELYHVAVQRMVDKMLGRYISNRENYDIRQSIGSIINLITFNQQIDLEGDTTDEGSSGSRCNINFVCDDRVPRKGITYGQEIKQCVFLLLEFCTDCKLKKTISIKVMHVKKKTSTYMISIQDRKLAMSQPELDQAQKVKSVEHPYGNDRLYLVQTMLDQFQSKLHIDSSFNSGTTFSFNVVMLPSLVPNLDFGVPKHSLLPAIQQNHADNHFYSKAQHKEQRPSHQSTYVSLNQIMQIHRTHSQVRSYQSEVKQATDQGRSSVSRHSNFSSFPEPKYTDKKRPIDHQSLHLDKET